MFRAGSWLPIFIVLCCNTILTNTTTTTTTAATPIATTTAVAATPVTTATTAIGSEANRPFDPLRFEEWIEAADFGL